MATAQRSRVVRRRVTDSEEGASERKRPRQQLHVELPLPDHTNPVSGKIIRLEARNFMCHENLSFPFNSCVNFITGQNGSGKSAVLTAVIVGLGGRASTTDRGAQLGSMIRTGQKVASVKLTIQNCGDHCFKPEVYGGTITIERVIREKNSSYRLFNSTGKQVSTNKKDLVTLLDTLNIQVDNPIAILTQETSKNFLRSDDPKDKYKLFMRATTLQQIQEGYAAAHANRRLANTRLVEKEQSLTAVRHDVNMLERQVNTYKSINKIKEKVLVLKKQLAWAKVVEAEQSVETAQKELDTCQHKLQKLSDLRDRCQHSLKDVEEKTADLEGQKAGVMAEMEETGGRQEAQLKLTRQLRAEHQAAAAKLKTEKEQAADYRRERDRLVAEIQRQRREAQPDQAAAEEEQARQEEARLQTVIEQLTAAELTRGEHLQNCSETVRQRDSELKQLLLEEKQHRQETDALQSQLDRTKSSQANPRAVFGDWVAGVDRDIEHCFQQKRFKKKPIGPVGAYIKLRPGCEEWTSLVETSLTNVLKAYLVDDRHDMHIMTEILQKHCGREQQKPRVITSRFLGKVHDVSQHGIDSSGGLMSVWSVLDIDHPVVANAVIDQIRAESMLLLNTDEEAREMMAYRERVPRGCNQAYTKSGYLYFPDPAYRTYPAHVRPQPQYLQVSVQQALEDMKAELQQRRLDQQAVSDRVGRARAALNPARQQEQQAQQQLADAKQQLQQTKRELRRLQQRERPEPINLQLLEEEVESYAASLTEAEQKAADVQQVVDAAAAARQEAEQQRKVLAEEAKSRFAARTESLETELAAMESKRAGLQRNLERMATKLDEGRPMQERLLQVVDERRHACREVTHEAEAACDRADVRSDLKPRADIERRLQGLQRGLQEQSQRPQLSWEEVHADYQAAQLKLQTTENDVQLLQQEVDLLQQMLTDRDVKFEVLRRSLAARITQFFHTNLDARKFTGDIKFDHVARRLALTITPDRAGASSAAGSTLQLSGGERSFSTLAFILAMWSAMYSPFRMLDEFDVFMDEVNRKIGHDMLLKEALSRNSQFVFISPLTIDTQDNPRITVHSMRPPVRDAKP